MNPTRPGPTAVDISRPFGAHLRISWWKPLIGATGLAAIVLLARMTRAPWRTLFGPLRAFDPRRLAHTPSAPHCW
jgi:uncharacterized protein